MEPEPIIQQQINTLQNKLGAIQIESEHNNAPGSKSKIRAPLATIPSHLKKLFKLSDTLISLKHAGTQKEELKKNDSQDGKASQKIDPQQIEESKNNDVADEPIRYGEYPCETVNLDSLDSKFADNRGVVETLTRRITNYANNGADKYAKARFD